MIKDVKCLKGKKFVFDNIKSVWPDEITDMIESTNVYGIIKDRFDENKGVMPYLTFDEVFGLWFLFRKEIDLSIIGVTIMEDAVWGFASEVFTSRSDCKRHVKQKSLSLNKLKVDDDYVFLTYNN